MRLETRTALTTQVTRTTFAVVHGMSRRKDIQREMASKRFSGPYARDTYKDGLGGDWTRDEHVTSAAPKKKTTAARKRHIGKASE